MSNKRYEYEVWELNTEYATSKWKLVTKMPKKSEAEEFVAKLRYKKNIDCYPYYEENYIYRIKRSKK